MSPHTNIHQTLTQIASSVKPKHQKLVKFGLSAYTLAPFQSAAGNARAVIPKFSTACRSSERLLKNTNIGNELNSVLTDLVKITPSSIVNVDHTDINYLAALVLAVQTHKGRAIPVFVESTFAHDIPSFGSRHSTKRTDRLREMRAEERKQTSWNEHIVSTLGTFISHLGFAPRFAFDRGFGSASIISYLISADSIFYIRLKSGRTVDDGRQQIKVKDITGKDDPAELQDKDGNRLSLRVIRSNKNRRCKEPWYILTNDFNSSREKIVRIYYHRFEIEESFKDAKHLFDLERMRFNRPSSIKAILILIFIGFALLFKWHQQKIFRYYRQRRRVPKHPKKDLSWVRDTWEIWQLINRVEARYE